MVKLVLKKCLPFKSYGKNSELPSKKFFIKMSIFVLQWRRLGKICGCAKIKGQLELVCFLKKNVLKSTK
jgi:hypothetical protein